MADKDPRAKEKLAARRRQDSNEIAVGEPFDIAAAEIYRRIDRELSIEEARADRLLLQRANR